MASQELILPGENDPSGHDVAAANETPQPALLTNFKKSLLASQEAKGNQNLIHADFKFTVRRVIALSALAIVFSTNLTIHSLSEPEPLLTL